MASQEGEAPWWAAFPEAKAECPRMEASEVKALLDADANAGQDAKRSFLLVDVRRTDWEGGTVKTSINLPAHTLYQTRPTIYQLCKQANVDKVIFYCGTIVEFPRKGSANGHVNSRKFQRKRAKVRRLVPRLSQRCWRDKHKGHRAGRRYQRLAEDVRRRNDGLV